MTASVTDENKRQQCRKGTKSQINGQINGRRTYVEGKMGVEESEEGKTGVKGAKPGTATSRTLKVRITLACGEVDSSRLPDQPKSILNLSTRNQILKRW